MAELVQLKAKRKLIRASITRFESFLKSFSDTDSIKTLRLRHDDFKSILGFYNEVQDAIGLVDEVSAADENERVAGETRIYNLLTVAEEKLEKRTITSSATSAEVKLPTINLPNFNGSYTEWTAFYNSFKSLIHENLTLDNIQKLHYLRSCLGEEPLRIIESLLMTANSYNTAWELLKDRYQSKRLIVHHHIHNLCNLPVVNKQPNSLRSLLDQTNAHLESLKAQHIEIDKWDAILVYLMTSKFDFATKQEWDSKLTNNDIPTMAKLKEFIKQRCQSLESFQFSNPGISSKHQPLSIKSKHYEHTRKNNTSHVVHQDKCPKCKQIHSLFQCPSFLQLNENDRYTEAKKVKVCLNCLREGHDVKSCKSQYCKTCNGKHHTLLHFVKKENTNVSNQCSNNLVEILLSTAVIKVKDSQGVYHDARALLDAASQDNFITENLCRSLNLTQIKKNIPICGIGQSQMHISYVSNVVFKTNVGDYSETIQCLVLPQITNNLPLDSFDPTSLNIPENLNLADPEFYSSSPVDILIGAALFYDLLRDGRIKINNDKTYVQNSALGWLLGGPYNVAVFEEKRSRLCHFTSSQNLLEKQVTKFWEVEHFEPRSNFTTAEQQCDNFFVETTIRNPDGRFIVSIPFKNKPINIGSTRELAIKRLRALEIRFRKNSGLKQEYDSFLNEYLQLGHMEKVEGTVDPSQVVYLAHHGVIKESSMTTKTRVVFDGSARSTNGLSLNDNLLTGPNLQTDLFSIIAKGRLHKYALSADIKKMFRQILINPEDRDFLRFIYRLDPHEPFTTYRLKTVTYGLTCAPFLAIRCLRELALQAAVDYPEASKVILNNFYMDDLFTGIDTIEEGIKLRNDLTNILIRGGFELYKWASNNKDILPEDHNISNSAIIRLDSNFETKALGLTWNCEKDCLKYQISAVEIPNKATKRNVLSIIAKIFDPLGLLSPILITAKILLQKLWVLKLSWDEQIPEEMSRSFYKFCELLPAIDNFEIPRSVIQSDFIKFTELHGFCDASKDAYGAAIFMRTVNEEGIIDVHLLCSKSRVSPLKTLTIPRLELCAAALLAKLAAKVIEISDIIINKFYFWSDSKVTLSWISADPNKWQAFVAHRVTEIQNLTQISNWHYVPTEHNPADLITRGMLLNDNKKLQFWFRGPPFLYQNKEQWPTSPCIAVADIPEKRKVVLTTTLSKQLDLPVFYRASKFSKLKRIVAYSLRFIYNCRHPNDKISGQLSVVELQKANNRIIKIVQSIEFGKEISDLKTKNQLTGNSSLITLNAFLDENEILRVGGHLRNAPIHYDMKHQILLPKNHVVTKLIIRDTHISLLHGIQATIAAVRLMFWPITIKSTTRKIIHNCVKCRHTKPFKYEQLMGNLPFDRVTPARPFQNSGVDYAGPILVKERHGRGKKATKAYVAVFVCLATKALHLELVHDYSSESFLNALKRMMARRGKISHLYSDNGTNFVGANRELKEIKTLFDSIHFQNDVVANLANEGIQWKFIPPNSPYVGGIWEAGVKSFKNLFKRVAGNYLLTVEEMYTLLALIESCLNSRPITPLSDDPNDLQPLTPGHFLIGCALTAPLEVNVLELPENRLSRWQRIERLRQELWKRWTKEYLVELQRRSKWKRINKDPLKVGSMVILREDNLPPLQWKMGRIVELHPGNDNITRVVSVKTVSGVTKRAVNRVCVLPVDE